MKHHFIRGIAVVVAFVAQVAVVPTGASLAGGSTGCQGTGEPAHLAEGSTGNGFREWVLLANPSLTEPAEACITYLTGGGPVAGGQVSVPPRSRRSIDVNAALTANSVSTVVESLSGRIVAERSMSNSNDGLKGAHAGKQTPEPRDRWYLPEGSTLGGTTTWILISNPADEAVEITATFLTGAGAVDGPKFSIPPLTRKSVRANDFVSSYDVATEIVASGGVLAERATYLAHSGLAGSTASPGTASPAKEWYFSEGATAGGFETWILVANPSETETAAVALEHITKSASFPGASIQIPPRSRRSVRLGAFVTSYHVATIVRSSVAVVTERAMYSDHPQLGRGSATSEGSSELGKRWLFAEGATTGGYETWLLISNPGVSETAEVAISYLTTSGGIDGPSVSVLPGRRASIRVDDSITSFDVGIDISVVDGPPVMAERSIFTPSGPGRDLTTGPGLILDEHPALNSDPVVIAVGDAACDPTSPNFNGGVGIGDACRQLATSDIALSESASAVLMLGDAQYETGALPAFMASYEPSWGRLKSITRPAPGNHEYFYGSADGYYTYFGDSAGDPAKGWYSFDIGAWHLVALNSNCGYVGGCGAGSAQEVWLRADLAAHSNQCTLAYWHHPRFSSGQHGENPSMDAFWRALHDAGADLILGGHDHNYERFAPQTPDSVSDSAGGIREFVVGTGGKDLRSRSFTPAHSEVYDYSAPGVLKLTLRPSGYDWEFKAIPGELFADSGSASCH